MYASKIFLFGLNREIKMQEYNFQFIGYFL